MGPSEAAREHEAAWDDSGQALTTTGLVLAGVGVTMLLAGTVWGFLLTDTPEGEVLAE